MPASLPAEAPAATTKKASSASTSNRIVSIDALRGFVMFAMIFVNDLAGAPRRLVPDWMVHFSDRHRGGSGMTFVDLVFPGFLFIVGMSIPLALGGRMAKGEPVWKTVLHMLTRTLALLAIGILMVNGESSARSSADWSPALWATTMFLSAMLAFCTIKPPGVRVDREKFWKITSLCLRGIGFAGMLYCALTFHGRRGQPVLTLSPLHINTGWYGILGLIGWAYLAGSIVYLIFRTNRTALLGCVALMMCFYAADQHGFFDNFPPNHIVDFGSTLGSGAAITVAGLLLSSILVTPDKRAHGSRASFTLLFAGGFAFAAMLVNGLYGISKNNGTPSWCMWACAITALLWLMFYFVADVIPATRPLAKPWAIAGQNVLLAYLISEMLPGLFDLLHWDDWYGALAEHTLAGAIARSVGCSIFVLALAVGLNRVGLRLKL